MTVLLQKHAKESEQIHGTNTPFCFLTREYGEIQNGYATAA
jgi:hypothetical protein